jgi:oligogalacturonide transport system substrate-binding protein
LVCAQLLLPLGIALGDLELALGPRAGAAERGHTGIFGRPALMFAAGRHTKQPVHAARLIEFLLTDPEAARLLGRTRGLPSARPAFEQLKAGGQLPPLELEAYEQVNRQRVAGRIPLPAPLFEHPRMHKFLREVFELVAYRKTTDEAAASRLLTQGAALLKRLQ